MSSRPNRSRVSWTSVASSSQLRTSQRTPSAGLPSAASVSARFLASSASSLETTTAAPALASSRAVAQPMPRVARVRRRPCLSSRTAGSIGAPCKAHQRVSSATREGAAVRHSNASDLRLRLLQIAFANELARYPAVIEYEVAELTNWQGRVMKQVTHILSVPPIGTIVGEHGDAHQRRRNRLP
jgi:hypothetical protein